MATNNDPLLAGLDPASLKIFDELMKRYGLDKKPSVGGSLGAAAGAAASSMPHCVTT